MGTSKAFQLDSPTTEDSPAVLPSVVASLAAIT
jgi:hypothetical protein